MKTALEGDWGNSEVSRLNGLEYDRQNQLILDSKALRWQRIIILIAILLLFAWLNWEVISMISSAINTDIDMLRNKLINPSERIINTSVYLALIAGVVTEVATLLIVIANYLFPKK